MRLSELSRAAGVPPATVKWYLRIGLLPRGTATAANQAQYGDPHLRRLLLIRALIEVGGLSVEAVRAVADAIDDRTRGLHEVLGVAHAALATPQSAPVPPSALAAVDRFVADRGWSVTADCTARRDLAAVLAALDRLHRRAAGTSPATVPLAHTPEEVSALLTPYADAVDALAANEVAGAPADMARDDLVERVVTGTILMEQALTALRRLAQKHHSAKRYTGNPVG